MNVSQTSPNSGLFIDLTKGEIKDLTAGFGGPFDGLGEFLVKRALPIIIGIGTLLATLIVGLATRAWQPTLITAGTGIAISLSIYVLGKWCYPEGKSI